MKPAYDVWRCPKCGREYHSPRPITWAGCAAHKGRTYPMQPVQEEQ